MPKALQNFEKSSNMPKMKKSRVQLALKPFFDWIKVPENPISGTRSVTNRYALRLSRVLDTYYQSSESSRKVFFFNTVKFMKKGLILLLIFIFCFLRLHMEKLSNENWKMLVQVLGPPWAGAAPFQKISKKPWLLPMIEANNAASANCIFFGI